MKNSTSGAGTSTDGCSSTKTRLFCCQKWKCKVCSWRCLLSTVQLLECEGDSLSLSPSDYRWREHQRRTFQMKTASSFLHRHRSGEKWLQSADDRSTEKDWSHSPWTEDRGLRTGDRRLRTEVVLRTWFRTFNVWPVSLSVSCLQGGHDLHPAVERRPHLHWRHTIHYTHHIFQSEWKKVKKNSS